MRFNSIKKLQVLCGENKFHIAHYLHILLCFYVSYNFKHIIKIRACTATEFHICVVWATLLCSLCLDVHSVNLHSRDSLIYYTACPTRYRTRHFFGNSNTNEDIATKFEHEYVRCVRNEEECVCSPLQISLQYPH